ncbi:response regulator [Sphingomonas flavalba]|uniref:response regulator n=1 Tax=Sphingomonas flavalba TaxID=2559804 RepID=UPI0039E017CD
MSQSIGPAGGSASALPPAPALRPGWQHPDHIVIVDDDPAIRTLLSRILRESGYDASGAENAAELERIMVERTIALVLLDIMMPGVDGLSLCRAIRARSKVPIIMISARGDEADRVAGLDIGADDYIAKPFGRPEVLARIRAVLRRTGDLHLPLDLPAPEHFAFGGWHYRPRQRELLAPSGAEVELTGAEHELLLTLLRHPQRMIGRERLLELARSRLSHASDRSIDVLISRLRRKMGDGRRGGRPMIRTIRGVGYMMAVDVEAR